MNTLWYYAQNGAQAGPIPEDQLKGKLASGALQPSALVWSAGLPAWIPAAQVPALMPAAEPSPAPRVRATLPPPPPPSPAPVPAPAPAPAPAPLPAARAPLPAPAPISPQAWDARPLSPPAAAAPDPAGRVSTAIVEILGSTRPWVRFLSVLGFLGLGMMALGSIGILVVPMESMGSSSMGPRVAAALIYLLCGLVQLPSVLFLHRYASGISALAASRDPADLERALRAQKSFWKYAGMLTLIAAVVGALALIGLLAVAGFGLLRGVSVSNGL